MTACVLITWHATRVIVRGWLTGKRAGVCVQGAPRVSPRVARQGERTPTEFSERVQRRLLSSSASARTSSARGPRDALPGLLGDPLAARGRRCPSGPGWCALRPRLSRTSCPGTRRQHPSSNKNLHLGPCGSALRPTSPLRCYSSSFFPLLSIPPRPSQVAAGRGVRRRGGR